MSLKPAPYYPLGNINTDNFPSTTTSVTTSSLNSIYVNSNQADADYNALTLGALTVSNPVTISYAPSLLSNTSLGYFYTGTNLGSNTSSPNITDGTTLLSSLVQVSTINILQSGNYLINVYFNTQFFGGSNISNFTSVLTTANTGSTISVSTQTISGAKQLSGSPFCINNNCATYSGNMLVPIEFQCLCQIASPTSIYLLCGQSSFSVSAPQIQATGIILNACRIG